MLEAVAMWTALKGAEEVAEVVMSAGNFDPRVLSLGIGELLRVVGFGRGEERGAGAKGMTVAFAGEVLVDVVGTGLMVLRSEIENGVVVLAMVGREGEVVGMTVAGEAWLVRGGGHWVSAGSTAEITCNWM